MMKSSLFFALLLLSVFSGDVSGWCTTAGGVGDHSTHCPSSVGENVHN